MLTPQKRFCLTRGKNKSVKFCSKNQSPNHQKTKNKILDTHVNPKESFCLIREKKKTKGLSFV